MDREGNKRTTTEVRAQTMQMLGSRDDRPSTEPKAPAPQVAEPEQAYEEDDVPF